MPSRPAILPLLAALLAVLAAAIPARAQLDPPTTKGNVTIQLPKGWGLGTRGLIAAQAPQPDKDATGTFQASLSITQEAGGPPDGQAQQAALAKQFPGYRAVEPPAPVTINGLTGVAFGGTFNSATPAGNIALRSRQYMFTLNNQLYTITFTSLSSTWAGYQALIQSSVATFTIKH